MASIPLLKTIGLFSGPNALSATPPGALVTATNCVIRSRDIIEPRRGLKPLTYTFGAGSDRCTAISFYKGSPIIQYGTGKHLAYDTGSAFTTYTGTYTEPDAALIRMMFAEAAQSLFFTTNAGIYKLDELTGAAASGSDPGNPCRAGLYRPPDIKSTTTTGASGFLANNSRAAYRYTVCFKDANNIPLESPPSGRSYVTNTSGGTVNVSVTLPVTSDMTTAHFYRVYRTAQIASATADPGDEMLLVYEKYFTAAQIAAGTLTFTDIATDAVYGGAIPLYTNPLTGQGILQSNDPPPLAKDICLFNNRMWFANTTSLARLPIELLGVSDGTAGNTGLRLTDTITIDGNTFTAASTYSATAPLKWIATSSASSASLKLQDVAQSLCYSINSTALNTTVRAYYVSDGSAPFGSIVLEGKTPAVSSFSVSVAATALPAAAANIARAANVVTVTITGTEHGLAVGDVINFQPTGSPDANFAAGSKTIASTPAANSFTYAEAGANATSSQNYTVTRTSPAPATAWNPDFVITQTSTNDAAKNRVFYSKLQQYEAVPLLNYLDIGSKDYQILRIIPQNDRLFVLKEDGVFVISGEYPFRVDALDRTVRLLAPNSAASVNGLIYCLTNKGLVAISQGGVAKVSPQISQMLSQYMSSTYLSTLKQYAFGLGYESEGWYILYLPAAADDQVALVMNVNTGAFTKWTTDLPFCAGVNPSTDLLYVSHNSSNTLRLERKSFNASDYADEQFSLTTSAWDSSASNLTVNSTTNIQVNDTIEDAGNGWGGKVSAVVSGTVLTLTGVYGTVTVGGTVIAYRPYTCTIQWHGQDAGRADLLKHFREVTYHFQHRRFYDANATLHTNLISTAQQTPLIFSDRALPRTVSGGDYLSISNVDDTHSKRILVGAENQRASILYPGFTITEALAYWQLSGLTVEFEPSSERGNR